MDKQEWLESRRKIITASDAASVLGYGMKSPLRVWLEKVHPELLEPEECVDLLEWGNAIEPLIAQSYQKATGLALSDPGRYALEHHPDYPEIGATIDRITSDRKKIVEIKWQSMWADKFGDPGTSEVPDAYAIQCAVQMAVIGCEAADIATMRAGPPLLVYPLYRDLETEKLVIDACRAFWADYVLTKKEPPIDASRDWAAYIEKKFPEGRGEIKKATPEEADCCRLCVNAMKILEKAEDNVEQMKTAIKSLIGDADGIEGEFGRITWKLTKSQIADVTDWKKVSEVLAEEMGVSAEGLSLFAERYTEKGKVIKNGSRRFLCKFR